jgi:hypothetical protein
LPGAEGADADDRVARVHVDVCHRRQVLADADGAELLAGHAGRLAGEPRVAGGADGHGAGQLRGRRTKAPNDAVLLVGADEDGRQPGLGGCLLDAVREPGDLPRAAQVAGELEVDDRAHVIALDELARIIGPEVAAIGATCAGRGVVRPFAVDAAGEELAHLLAQRHALDEPAVTIAGVGDILAGHRCGASDGGTDDRQRYGEDRTASQHVLIPWRAAADHPAEMAAPGSIVPTPRRRSMRSAGLCVLAA